MNDIEPKVIKVISDALRIKTEKIFPESAVFRDLGAESLDMLDIRFRLEKEFSLKIPDGEIMASFKNSTHDEITNEFSVAHIVDFIKGKHVSE